MEWLVFDRNDAELGTVTADNYSVAWKLATQAYPDCARLQIITNAPPREERGGR